MKRIERIMWFLVAVFMASACNSHRIVTTDIQSGHENTSVENKVKTLSVEDKSDIYESYFDSIFKSQNFTILLYDTDKPKDIETGKYPLKAEIYSQEITSETKNSQSFTTDSSSIKDKVEESLVECAKDSTFLASGLEETKEAWKNNWIGFVTTITFLLLIGYVCKYAWNKALK